MAISFHPETCTETCTNLPTISIRKDKYGGHYLSFDGHIIRLPSASNYFEVVQTLIVMQEFFTRGFTLVDNTEK